jgi:benzoate transport
MNTYNDPRELLSHAPMGAFQIMAVAICVFLNGLDGFDIQSISFAAPGITADWGINRAELGIVLSMELFGMAVGSVLFGGMADKSGRRPTILLCLVLMTVGMYAASLVASISQLLIARFVTGLGIGGMLATTNPMAAEFSNQKNRSLAVIFMATGYPLGAIIGGSVSTVLLQTSDWRAIFEFGAAITAVFLLVVYFFLPESIEYLSSKQPENALDKINRILKKMGHAAVNQLPSKIEEAQKAISYQVLFNDKFRALTLLLVIGYFMHIMTFYYILKWIPTIVVDMGYEPALAGTVLVWANVGGAIGALLLGITTTKYNLRKMMIGVLIVAFVMVSVFGFERETISDLAMIAAVTGFFTNGGVVGFYALIADAFPADIRGSGTGVVIGIGRGGAALGPVIAGLLFVAGFNLLAVSIVMGAGAAVAAIAIYFLRPAAEKHSVSANI